MSGTYDMRQLGADLARRTRAAQGLAAKVQDQAALGKTATILAAARRKAS